MNNRSMKAFGGFLVLLAFCGAATAQKFRPEPDDEGFEEVESFESADSDDIDLEFSEDERARLRELRAWLRQRSLERARAAAFDSGDADEASRFDSNDAYRPVRPPQLLHDARNWQGRPKLRLPVGRVRDNYDARRPKIVESPRRKQVLAPAPGYPAGVRRPSMPVETKAKSRVRLVWTSDAARRKSGLRQPSSDRRR